MRKGLVKLVAVFVICSNLVACSTSRESNEKSERTSDASNVPEAYIEILAQCNAIIDDTEDGCLEINDSLGSLYWFADQALHVFYGESRDVFCYSLTDLNSDGVEELIIACRYDIDDSSIYRRAGYLITDIYTLAGDEAVLLGEASPRRQLYLNADGLIIDEHSTTYARHEIRICALESDSAEFTSEYHLYNEYLEDSNQLGLYESRDGQEAELIMTVADPSDETLWERFDEVRASYIAEFMDLELVPIGSVGHLVKSS